MNSLTVTSKFAAALVAAGLSFAVPAPSFAVVGEAGCGTGNAACSWSIEAGDADGSNMSDVGKGTYSVNPETGAISFSGEIIPLMDGSTVQLTELHGNIDPVLGFSTNATTAGVGKTFAFSISVPIALDGPINAFSTIGTTLTAFTTAGAEVKPFFQSNLLVAADVDTSVGGLDDLDKEVEAGNKLTIFPFVGPPDIATKTATDTNSSSFIGASAYDLMSIRLSYSLSPNSGVGLSGAVQQDPVPVPEPSTYGMLLAGLFLVGFVARRRLHAS